jgi:hypothetical protein
MRARSGPAFLLSVTTVLAVMSGSAPASQIAYDDLNKIGATYADVVRAVRPSRCREDR